MKKEYAYSEQVSVLSEQVFVFSEHISEQKYSFWLELISERLK